MADLARDLEALGAYRDLVAWCEPFGSDVERAIAECPRGDWVIAIGVATDRPRAAIVRAACACAELALELVEPDAISAALAAIAAARAWAEHAAPIDPAIASACQALGEHPDPLVQTAALAACAALASVDEPREAPAAAASAASAAALHAADCGMIAAVSYAQRRTADLARDEIVSSRREDGGR
jgi:hypothetical protein